MTTNEDLERMTPEQLDAWVEANAEGPREPASDRAQRPRAPMTSVTMRMPGDLLDQLKAAAAERKQPYQRFMRDVLLLGLVVLRERPGDAHPATVRLSPAQMRQLEERGTLTLRVERPRGRPHAPRRARSGA